MPTNRILIIEDNIEIRQILADMLHELGNYKVYLAQSGEEGLAIIQEYAIDMVLMDIGLKGSIDGIQTAESISKQSDIPVIYITGASDRETIDRAKLTSPYGYLIKPIDFNQLQVTIEIAFNKYRYEHEIQNQRQLLSTTLSSISDGVITTDDNGNITYINNSAEKITGLDRSEVLGENVYSTLASLLRQHPEDDPSNSNRSAKESDLMGTLLGDSSIITRQKEEVPVEISSSPIIDIQHESTGKVFIIRDITERKENEKKLQAYQEKLRSLSSSLSVMEDTQRRKFALQLHETIGQKLAMGKVTLANAINLKSLPEIKKVLHNIYNVIDDAIQNIRMMTSEISPPALYEIGLSAGIQWLIERVQSEYNLSIYFENSDIPLNLGIETKIILFHSIRELVNNAAQHSKATELRISIAKHADSISIKVSDDGQGFDVDKLMAEMESDERLGLFNIREKVEYLQGNFTLKSTIGEGTTGVITVPLSE